MKKAIKEYIDFDPIRLEPLPEISPYDLQSMVYFLYQRDQKGRLQFVYVGQTIRGLTRIAEHMEKIKVDRWTAICVPPELLDDVELHYIQTYRPPLNKKDNPDFAPSEKYPITVKLEIEDKEFLAKRCKETGLTISKYIALLIERERQST